MLLLKILVKVTPITKDEKVLKAESRYASYTHTNSAMTLGLKTFSITTLSMMGLMLH